MKRLKKEKFVKENVYNEQLQDKYMRKVLEEDKKFDDDFELIGKFNFCFFQAASGAKIVLFFLQHLHPLSKWSPCGIRFSWIGQIKIVAKSSFVL